MIRKRDLDMRRKKTIALNMLLNIIATALPTCVLQFFIYPSISTLLTEDRYGLMLTVLSVMQLIYGSLGSSLNEVRLLRENKYQDNGEKGDFNLILIVILLISLGGISVCSFIYLKTESLVCSLIIIISTVLLSLLVYLEVYFRLILNFKRILITNLLMSFGYLAGYGLFKLTNEWALVYLTSALFPLVYVLFVTPILHEPFKKTNLFSSTVKDTLNLTTAGLCTRVLVYADKIILFPLLGGAQVAVYHAATFIGKVVLMATKPVNSVILSYLSKTKKMSKRTTVIYCVSIFLICVVGYFLCLFVSQFVLDLTFPQYKNEAFRLIPITTLSLLIITYASFITPLTLKFCKMIWQVIVNSFTMLIYTISIFLLNGKFGLIGFCWGVVIGYSAKLILLMLVFLLPSTKQN